MNKDKKYLLEIAMKLKELKEQRPDKFYELKGIVNTVYSIQTGNGIEDMLSGNINN